MGLCRSNSSVGLKKKGKLLFIFSDALLKDEFASLKEAIVREKSFMKEGGRTMLEVYL